MLFRSYYIWKLAYPFIIAVAIALLINPMVNGLEKWLPRIWAVTLSLIMIVAIFAGLITLLIAEIVSGANYLAEELPKHVQTLVTYAEDIIVGQVIPLYNQLAGMFKNLEAGQQDTILENIQTAGTKIATSAGDFLQNFFTKLPQLISWIDRKSVV